MGVRLPRRRRSRSASSPSASAPTSRAASTSSSRAAPPARAPTWTTRASGPRRTRKDAAAQLALAEALQLDGKPEEAIAPLQRYLKLRANDEEALQTLAGLYLSRAQRIQDEAARRAAGGGVPRPGPDFRPDRGHRSSATRVELGVHATSRRTRPTSARPSCTASCRRWPPSSRTAHERIAQDLARRSDACSSSSPRRRRTRATSTTALAAYKRFLKLAPDDPSAEVVREQIKLLEQSAAPAVSSG